MSSMATQLAQAGQALAESVNEKQICARGLVTRQLNQTIFAWVREQRGGAARVVVSNLTGQRYLGTNLAGYPVRLDLYGTPGNDLGAFLDGPTLWVHGNAQDGVGNTMNAGRIVVEGSAGDVAALSARGGELFIWGNVGYRACLHMKEYQGQRPLVVVGGTAQDFFGEYMAGGVAVLLGLGTGPGSGPGSEPTVDSGGASSQGGAAGAGPLIHRIPYLATGMHGGVIYLRGEWDPSVLSTQVEAEPVASLRAEPALAEAVGQFTEVFSVRLNAVQRDLLERGPYWRIRPRGKRPYARLYA